MAAQTEDSFAQSLYEIGIQTRHQDLLHTWLDATMAQTSAISVQVFLLNQANTQLEPAAKRDKNGFHPGNPDNLSMPSGYSSNNALTLCLSEGRLFSFQLSQCNQELRQLLFSPSERFSLSDGTLTLLPLHQNGNSQTVKGVMVVFTRSAKMFSCQPLNTLNTLAMTKLEGLYQAAQSVPEPKKAAPQRQQIDDNYGLIGQSEGIKNIRRRISQVLHVNHSVLITGPTGTGKEVVARAIHYSGSRRTQAYKVQNCASIPEQLLESELFGYQKGAFTGADSHYEGLFRAANGGTLFLDEIGDMPLALQSKLLRVLEEKKVRPLGSTRSYDIDVRVVAATHQNLKQQIEEGGFRRDLYYRLAQYPIELMPLCKRDNDVILLAEHFIDEYAKEHNKPPLPLHSQAAKMLKQYSFPGNIRELKNLISRAMLFSDGATEISPSVFQDELIEPGFHDSIPMAHMAFTERSGYQQANFDLPQDEGLDSQLDRFELQLLTRYLGKYQGNLRAVAKDLKLSRGALDYRLRKFNLYAKDWRP